MLARWPFFVLATVAVSSARAQGPSQLGIDSPAPKCVAAACLTDNGGITLDQIDSASAMEACEVAHAVDPREGAVVAALERACLRAGRYASVRSVANDLAVEWSARSQFLLGELYLDKAFPDNSPPTAVTWVRRAADGRLDDDDSQAPPGTRVLALGWGITETSDKSGQLREIALRIVGQDQCGTKLTEVRLEQAAALLTSGPARMGNNNSSFFTGVKEIVRQEPVILDETMVCAGAPVSESASMRVADYAMAIVGDLSLS